MPLNYQPRQRRNPVEDFLGGFQGSLGIAKTLQGMRESGEELKLKRQEVEQKGRQIEQQDIQARMKNVTDLISSGQEEAATEFFNNDPILQKYIGPNVGGKVTFNKKEDLIKGANGFVGRYKRNAPAGTNPFEVLHDPTKILSPAEQFREDAIKAMKEGKLAQGFQTLEEQRKYGLGIKETSTEFNSPGAIRAGAAKKLFPDDPVKQDKWIQQQEIAEAKGKQVQKPINPSDWLTIDPETNEISQATTDMTPAELRAGGYREIKSLKDRKEILGDPVAVDLQFQKLESLADEYKKTSAISLGVGQLPGGTLIGGSSVGGSMPGVGRQYIQFLEKSFGGVRAAGSKPLLDAASAVLLPRVGDANELIDLKMQSLKILTEGMRNNAKRSAFGLGPDPAVKAEVLKYIDLVKKAGKPASTQAAPSAGQRLRFDANGNPIP